MICITELHLTILGIMQNQPQPNRGATRIDVFTP